MSAVAAFGATAPSAARVCARLGRGGGAASTWLRARALQRTVARSAAADVEAMASASDAETGAADDDDLRFVYVGNFDFFTLEETVEAAVRDLLGEALRDRVRSMAVPGWRDKRLEDGTLKPRKKRDQGKRNRGFAVVEFDTPQTGRAAAEALDGVVFETRALRSSAGVRADVRGAPRRRAEPKSETAAEAGETSEAERARRERRAHNRRQKRRKKARDDAALEEALRNLLRSHPLWEPCAESQTIDEPEDAERAEEPLEEPLEDASSDRFAENASRVSSTNLETREWWDDARWRGGWGALYSRWRDLDFAKALGAVDWENCAPSVDPAGSNTLFLGAQSEGGVNGYRYKTHSRKRERASLQRTRCVRPHHRQRRRYASPAVTTPFHRALLARASARDARVRARRARASVLARRTLALFRVATARFCAAGARFCVALAARRGRGVLFESCARAGLTAGRARRPGGGVRRRARNAAVARSPWRDARGDARRATRSRAYPSLESSYRAVVPSPDGVFARDMRSGEHLAPFTLAGAHALTTTPSAS